MIKDVTFEIDEFSRNKIISESMAMAQQLYILLNMEPGDVADEPDKGINIKKYRIGWADELAAELKAAIESQVQAYCDYQTSEVEIIYNDGELLIGITSPSFSDIVIFTATPDNTVLTTIMES